MWLAVETCLEIWDYKVCGDRGFCIMKVHPARRAHRVAIYASFVIVVLKIVEIMGRSYVIILLGDSCSIASRVLSHPVSTISPLECLLVVLVEKRFLQMCCITLKTIPRFVALLASVCVGISVFAILGT